jgi:hypothetical protein
MDSGRLPGVFICGRQHSGNTMLTHLIGRMAGCVFDDGESIVLEHRARLDRLPTASQRAEWILAQPSSASEPTRQIIARELCARAQQRPQADTVAILHKMLSVWTDACGGTFWARKATSYIFHAGVILSRMPEVKMVYLMRNPLDGCASHKRRNSGGEYLVGPALAWRRGAELAAHYRRRFPDRFHIVRYEDVLVAPEVTVRELCDFLLRPYDPALLDVPLINTSESAYRVVEGVRGIQQSRANRYAQTLNDAEIFAVRTLCSAGELRRWYPDCPAADAGFGLTTRLKALGLIARGAIRLPVQFLRRVVRTRMPMWHFVSLRARILLGGVGADDPAAVRAAAHKARAAKAARATSSDARWCC